MKNDKPRELGLTLAFCKRDICSNEINDWDVDIGSIKIGNEEFVEFEQITFDAFSTG